MKNKLAIVALALLSAGTGLTLAGSASAAIPNTPIAANSNVLPQARRIVPFPGMVVLNEQTVAIKVAGKSFDDATVPADATGVVVSVTALAPNHAGSLRVWTTGAGTPSTGAVEFAKGETKTNLAFVALADLGSINVQSIGGATKFVMALMSYETPVAVPVSPVVVTKSIAPVARKVIDVGGSIRTRGTVLGDVTLTEGTWDARATASWTGLNASNTTIPESLSFNGTFVLVKGDGTPADDNTIMATDFSNNITVSVPSIPRVSSATLTVDPTGHISDFITVPAGQTLKVTAVVFAAASDSSQTGSGVLKAGLDSATFLKVS
jgi:hypothetical protein